MKKIPLTQGLFTIVDDKDYEWLNQWKWYATKDRHTFYAIRHIYINGKQRRISMHRLLLGLSCVDKKQGDHRNGNGLDNYRENLRVCSNSQNHANERLRINNQSGYRGVYWQKKAQKWEVQIRVYGQKIHLGLYTILTEAARAYDRAAIKHFGEFAKPNFPMKTFEVKL